MLKHIKNWAFFAFVLALGASASIAQNTTGSLPNAGLIRSTDTAVINRSGVTMQATPFQTPATGSVMISNGTAAPTGVAPINNYCLQGVGSVWTARPCIFSDSVTYTGSPVLHNLAQFASASVIEPANLSGDVTTAGGLATTVAKIGGNTVSLGGALTTAGAFTMSGAHTFTGTLSANTNVTFPTSGTLSTTTGTVTSVTFTGDGTLLSSTPSSAVTASGTVTASLATAAADTVLGNATGSTAAPTYTTAPVVSGASTAASFVPTSSTPPTIGMFKPSSNTLGFALDNTPGTDFELDGTSLSSVAHIAVSAVSASSATVGPLVSVTGSNSNSALTFRSKGTGVIDFQSGFNHVLTMQNTASTADYFSMTGSAAANPGVISLTVNSNSTDTNVTTKIASKGAGTVQLAGHAEGALGDTVAPTCGTGCTSITSGSTDVRGSLVTSAAVSAITLNFGTTWASAPFCVISDSSTATVADISALSTSALTVSTAANVTSITVYWHCMQ